jgi:DNA-binding CsgD family transcriptional regulator
MSSTAMRGEPVLSNLGLPRSDWESMFWAVFAASENPMAIVDANRWVVSANGGLQRLLSRAEEEVVGRSIDESLAPADQRTLADRWRAMLARGEGHGVQKLVVDHDLDTTVSYAAHVAHIGGRLVIFVVLMADRERGRVAAGSDSPPAPLTPRELEIIRRIALGATTREIADDLFVTTETVRTHGSRGIVSSWRADPSEDRASCPRVGRTTARGPAICAVRHLARSVLNCVDDQHSAKRSDSRLQTTAERDAFVEKRHFRLSSHSVGQSPRNVSALRSATEARRRYLSAGRTAYSSSRSVPRNGLKSRAG